VSLPRAVLDPKKLVQVRCGGRQVPRLRRALLRLGDALKGVRAARKRAFWILGAALLVGLVGLAFAAPTVANVTASMCVIGLAYGYFVQLASMLLAGRGKISGGGRFLVAFLLVNPGLFLYGGAGAYFSHVARTVDPYATPAPFVVGLVGSTLFVYWLSRIPTFRRLARLAPERLEVDYIARIAQPLLGDLAPEQHATLTFNPFGTEWSRAPVTWPSTRSGYQLEAWADTLLVLRAPIDERRELRLSIIEYAIHKTKIRKSKYKGTKRIVVYRYELETAAPSASPKGATARRDLAPALANHLAVLRKSWLPEQERTGDYFPQGRLFAMPSPGKLKQRAVLRPGRVVVTQMFKSASMEKTLDATALLPPSMVLATVWWMGNRAS